MNATRQGTGPRALFRLAPLWLAGLVLTVAVPLKAAERLELHKGDHISFIGNTLADRMQHDGWLETYLQARFPKHELSIRDLGFAADELTLRLRSANFGSPDHWLGLTRSDVVFAFFGYNESFAGKDGLDKFKKDLEGVLKEMLAQKYNGKSAPRIVLFSPIAFEDTHDRNLPDGKEINERLALYTNAMAEVARANGVVFVDLFKPTRALYPKAPRPLTINGVHLNAEGNHQLAAIIDQALVPNGAPLDLKALETLRAAVVDKNFYWFNRYRTVDGFSIFGGRADLRFTAGQTNRDVMQREMEVLDVMTANRDRRVWAVAQGGDLKVDDSNTPPFLTVVTNKPGSGPNGAHVFLDGDEAIAKMTIHKGMKINLFASEKEFPELAKPVQMSFDGKGRLWVAVWPTYPHWKPKEEMNDKILIFEDTDGDGRADKQTVFADHLHCPTGFELVLGGAIVAQQPDIMFLKDTDGDDHADTRERVVDGIDSADTHHAANSFYIDPGGALYFQEGTFHHTQIETPWGRPQRNVNAGVYRYEPRTQKLDVYVAYGFANPHGHVFDRWSQDIIHDGTGAPPYHGTLFSGHLDFPQKHGRPPQVYQQRTRPCPGTEILSSRHFPESLQNNLLVGNVIGFQGILQYKIEDDDSSFHGTEVEPIVSSTDPNFRPSDMEIGPDGALYFLDWQNPIIGHMQHNLRDPSRDRVHGRIYRVTYEGRPLLKAPKLAGAPLATLLDELRSPEDRARYRARIELGARPSDEVIAAARKWAANLDKDAPDYEHAMMELLWLHQSHNVVDIDLLKRMLKSSDFHARAAATRVLCYWRDRVPEALDLLRTLAADSYPRVRLEAVRAASFFTVPEALEVALISADHPSDEYLDYTRNETLKALEPYWKKAVAAGRTIQFTSEAGARFFLRNVQNDELLKMKRGRAVDMELLFRKGIRDEARREALADLATLDKKSELRVLVDAIRSQDDAKRVQDESVVFDLARLLTSRPAKELAGVRDDLEAIATTSKLPVIRQLALVALVAADGGIDKTWALAETSVSGLQDLLVAMPLIRDPGQRASLYPKVEPLLHGLPKPLAETIKKTKGTTGRYVRVELTGGRGTLSLAEVEVFSDGRNIAPRGRASQKNTSNGGDAKRAIDGIKDGVYGNASVTHTEEGTNNPYWEVDLGGEYPIDSIALYNRTDDGLGKRLNNFTLKVLDEDRTVVFEKSKQPAPPVQAAFTVGGGGSAEDAIRRAAMAALPTVRGQEAETFRALAKFVREGKDRETALDAIQRIPAKDWPSEEARPLLDSLLAFIRKLPVQDRTSPVALDALQVGDVLATALPKDEAKRIRKELGELGVRVLRIGTVTDQMLFNKDRLVVQSGKPFEVVFENTDIMPHNFVVTKPGALEEVGLLGESSATEADAIRRNYVPKSRQILLASRLLQPRESQKLDATAPRQAGVYPYVCTYPGHWRRMYGALYVVDDLDDYLADPEAYLAKNTVPIKDELLKFNRPRKEWQLEDLISSVEPLDPGRSFANGKQMFVVANCVACHKLSGVGNEIGPDLSKLDPKTTNLDILKNMLNPSEKIDDKYASYIFDTDSGKIVTGLILEETPEFVKVIENPLAKSLPLVLKKSEIAERKKSASSIMPKGLLDKLTREEILDLIAYVAAKGDERSPIYKGAHEHGHGNGH